jgi:general L-amino acid transport system permease protein
MSGTTAPPEALARAGVVAPRPPPPRAPKPLWRSLFGDALSTVISVLGFAGLATLLPRLLSWAVVHGVWTGGAEACREGGACWVFLRAKARLILFGIYPPDQQWRPMAAILIILGLTLWSLAPSRWNFRTLAAWVLGAGLALLLMSGGVLGLEPEPTSAWGGLPITLLLTLLSLAFGFPMAVALALGRRSEMPVVRWLSVGTIELVRGLPLVTILFVASILLPIMLPDGVDIDNLARALAALTVFSAAYIAEVLRGGLQGVPIGQVEAARALGMSWWGTTRRVVLPQAIGKVIPALTNTVVVIVKNTSLVLVVGLFDLLSAGRAALTDPQWPEPYVETYLFVALIYFAICFSISRYTFWLERRPALGGAR